MTPGETRAVNVREFKDGKLGETFDVIHVNRTNRPYAADLCDAYNARAGRSPTDEIAWHVDHAGNPRFGLTPAAEARQRQAFVERSKG